MVYQHWALLPVFSSETVMCCLRISEHSSFSGSVLNLLSLLPSFILVIIVDLVQLTLDKFLALSAVLALYLEPREIQIIFIPLHIRQNITFPPFKPSYLYPSLQCSLTLSSTNSCSLVPFSLQKLGISWRRGKTELPAVLQDRDSASCSQDFWLYSTVSHCIISCKVQ